MKNTPRRAVAVLAAAAIALSVAACQPTTSSAQPADASSSAAAAAKAAPGVGDKVRDGKFQFTVTKVKIVHRIGSTDFGQSAQGQFVVINLTVKNIGKSSQSLDGSSQVAYDASGTKYAFDTDAVIYLPSSNSFFVDVNPGNTLKGQLVYDVPKGTKLTKLKLHDSAFSGGATVKL